jgi:hypothetical protein
MIQDAFILSSGTVGGFIHRQKGINNQDGLAIAEDENNFAAIICDGCSSGKNSEVGAKLIARFAAEETIRLMQEEQVIFGSQILDRLSGSILGYMRESVEKFKDPKMALEEMFLATIVGVIMNEWVTTVFSLGDGVISLNGEVLVIDENNAPNYLAYRAYPGAYMIDEVKINFVVRQEVMTKDLQSLILASDGAQELIAKADREINILGKLEKVGGLNQFEQEERYLKNPSLLQKRLCQLNTERMIIDWEEREVRKSEGILSDDTTIVLMRRR